jgi:outer membrane receptor protein involved in Fe transport
MMRALIAVLVLAPMCAAAQQMPAPQPFCMPSSQAQAIVSWLSQGQALQLQMVEAAQAKDHEAAIITKAKAEQKAEDDAKAKP